MRRRRQQKLEKKLQQFRSRDGGPDTGGTLKIYGDALCQDVPYKTLLLSVRDTAAYVVREMLDKYSLDKEDPANYCLVQVKLLTSCCAIKNTMTTPIRRQMRENLPVARKIGLYMVYLGYLVLKLYYLFIIFFIFHTSFRHVMKCMYFPGCRNSNCRIASFRTSGSRCNGMSLCMNLLQLNYFH